MINEIKTEKFEGLAVLVPDLISGYKMYDDFDATIFDMDINYGVERKWIRLPKSKYELLGKATELTEEQCSDIVSQYPFGFVPSFKDYVKSGECHSAKESFNSLMQSLGCYSVNPFPYSGLKRKMDDFQSHTGTWLILQKL